MTVKNTKAKGTRNEHRSMRLLEAAGYACTRSAASLGDWDILGLGPQGAIVCQVKTRDWPSAAEMDVLRASCAWPYVTRVIHRWRDRQRWPDVRELSAGG